MKSVLVFVIATAASLLSPVSGSTANVNPINKVLSMISKLQNEVIQEGSEEQKMYTEFAHMCESRSRELHQEGKTSKAKVAESTASIEKNVADAALLQEKISSTASAIDDGESELKKAAAIRAKESEDFKAEEKSLRSTISSIERAITIVERGNGEDGASLAQVEQDRMESIASVFETMVEASAFNSYDQEKLTALVQTSHKQGASDEEDEVGAPSAAAYKGQGGGIVETLGALLEKAQKALDDGRSAESESLHGFEMQKQALTDKGKTLAKELGEAKKSLAQTEERKATAEGELEASKTDLAEGQKELEELHHECLDKANSFEESASSRNEELKALAEAKKIISDSSGGATKQTYDLAQTSQTSFLQVASSESQSVRTLHKVRHLALTHHSEALGKLAASVENAIQRSSASGGDPFSKVKEMVESMISQLEKKAAAGATKKAYCDKAMSETATSQEDKEDDVEKLAIQIDVMSADSKRLKADVSRLNKELSAITNVQIEMDKLRVDEKALYSKNKPELEQGLEGIKTALKVLREYYAKGDEGGGASGGASGIIGMLEVVESDFSKGLAAMISEEESAQNEYDASTKENQIAKATKEQDVKHKTGEFVSLDKSVVDLKTDKNGAEEELAAVKEYFLSVKKECVAQVDSYEVRKKRREDEIAGLKDALSSLGEGPSFLQHGMVQRALRGATVGVHQH